jgi:hypothetical protein
MAIVDRVGRVPLLRLSSLVAVVITAFVVVGGVVYIVRHQVRVGLAGWSSRCCEGAVCL